MEFPRISVVTPSFNQAAFLEQTILSVLGQCYPNLEYLVMDGGSSDESPEIIERYSSQLTYWQSQSDGGQAAAINAAFARATGEIFCWINSDDFLLPGALHRIARIIGSGTSDPQLIYGSCLFFHETGKRAKVIRPRPHDSRTLRTSAYVVQPSAFWTKALWQATGPLDEALSYAFDWDWFIRASAAGRFAACDSILAAYRFHDAHKSSHGGESRREEILQVARRHGEPAQIAAFEFLHRNWGALERRRAVSEALRQRRVPGAELWARLGVRVASPPTEASEQEMQLCAGMLRGA